MIPSTPLHHLSFASPQIDPVLHEWPDAAISRLNLGVGVVTPQQLEPFQPVLGGDDPAIRLPVLKFGQHRAYSHVPYDADQWPMVDFEQCIACRDQVLPASALVDRNGKRFLTVGICPTCGMIQQCRRPPKAFYPAFYRQTWDIAGRQRVPLEIMANDLLLKQIRSYLPTDGKVLEIGCGWGMTSLAFKEMGYEAHAIEATHHRAAFVNQTLGIPCFSGPAETLPIGEGPFQPGTFDVIYSHHVLEHVDDPRQVIEHLYPLLKDDGLFYIQLPNRWSENHTLHTHDLSHTCSFNQQSMLMLLAAIGFEVVRDYTNAGDIAILARKAPAATAQQLSTRRRWLAHSQPHRSLAHLLEQNGLARVPERLDRDLRLDTDWLLAAGGQPPASFIFLSYVFRHCHSAALNSLRRAIRERAPLHEIRHLLPIQWLYPQDGIDVWYY